MMTNVSSLCPNSQGHMVPRLLPEGQLSSLIGSSLLADQFGSLPCDCSTNQSTPRSKSPPTSDSPQGLRGESAERGNKRSETENLIGLAACGSHQLRTPCLLPLSRARSINPPEPAHNGPSTVPRCSCLQLLLQQPEAAWAFTGDPSTIPSRCPSPGDPAFALATSVAHNATKA